ncbi:MAG: ATP-binding protein [Fusicatenibacter saccharivorans]
MLCTFSDSALNQILLNLLSNATKFTQNGGTIIVRIIQKPYYKKGYALYEFHVRDNGIGMSREFQEHLKFESASTRGDFYGQRHSGYGT